MTDSALPYVLFEIANVHGGEVEHIERLVEQFGAFDYPRKGIKLQAFHADAISLPDYSSYGVYQGLTQPPEVWGRIIERAAALEDVWLDLFDVYGVELHERFSGQVAGLKLQASVLDNAEVVEALRSADLTRTTLMLNVAGYDLSRVSGYVEAFRALEPRKLILQAGFQGYPAEVADTGLQKVSVLRAAFPGLSVCFADHAAAGSEAARIIPALAVAAGCDYIEKHFCLSRAESTYDTASALEPDEMRETLRNIRVAAEASTGPFVNEAERRYLTSSYQAPVTAGPLRSGSLVSPSDVLFRRTDQTGLDWPALQRRQAERAVLARGLDALETVPADAFRDARIGVIVACRLKSSRLKQKALLPIAGIPSVERCLENCLLMDDADLVVLATSDLDEDAVLGEHTLGGRVEFVQGDADDVIQRYLDACNRYDLDVVVRVTADCPAVSPEIAAYLLQSHFETGADYSAAREAAVGSAPEIYNVEALRRVIELAGDAKHSEYMTWYLRNNPEVFKLNIVDLPDALVRDYRLTLDYSEDLEMFDRLYEELALDNVPARLANVFDVLDANESIREVNQDMAVVYQTDQALIDMLDRETKLS